LPELEKNYEMLTDNGTRFIDGIGSDIKQLGVKELAYPQTSVKSMGDLALMKMVRNNLHKLTVPALVFSSTVDNVVPPENSKRIFETIGSEDKEIVYLENSFHVATLDNDKERIAEESVNFI